MSRIYISNSLQNEATLIIAQITISAGQQGVTVSMTEPITRIEVRPKDPAELLKIFYVADDAQFENEAAYEARNAENGDNVLFVPLSPATVRFAPDS